MDIQIFVNFALSPTPENPAAAPSEKRAADEDPSDEPPTKRIKGINMLSDDEIADAVKILVGRYDLDKFQRADLLSVADDTQFVPTVEDVEWLAEEAGLREGSTHELPVWLFPYMEYYPWYLRSVGTDHRIFLGAFKYPDGMMEELWAGFPLTTKGSAQIHLYHHGPMCDDGDKGENERAPQDRRWLSWLRSIVLCFSIKDMMPRNLPTEGSFKEAAAMQDAYIKGMMKVLARFPGLILERDDYDDFERSQLYGAQWSAFPFECREESSPSNPLAGLLEMLCMKKIGRI